MSCSGIDADAVRKRSGAAARNAAIALARLASIPSFRRQIQEMDGFRVFMQKVKP